MTDGARAASDRVLAPAQPAKPSTLRRLEALAASVPDAADLVLIGDSLAASWPKALLEEALLERALLETAVPGAAPPARVPYNFGLPGERIQNTLWRLDTIPTGHLRPRHAVLLLGTNNLGDGDPPAAIAAGLAAVAGRLRALWGAPRLVAFGLPWRQPRDAQRERDRRAINRDLARMLAELGGRMIDPDPVLGRGPGATRDTVAADGLHLTEVAYGRMNAALAAALAEPGRDDLR